MGIIKIDIGSHKITANCASGLAGGGLAEVIRFEVVRKSIRNLAVNHAGPLEVPCAEGIDVTVIVIDSPRDARRIALVPYQ
jgi:hypothetical protein